MWDEIEFRMELESIILVTFSPNNQTYIVDMHVEQLCYESWSTLALAPFIFCINGSKMALALAGQPVHTRKLYAYHYIL